ncbi:MAG TPA: glycosyltransferase family 2 protein, partial [Flavisolibacter sp.]
MIIAILLTTFNRKRQTLACLHSLKKQQLPEGVTLKVFLTDDASKDGTADAVKQYIPDAEVYNGTGSLYWAGGMRSTWKKALYSEADFYLLLNDDTILVPYAVVALIQASLVNACEPAIAVGSTWDEASRSISYGGWRLRSKWLWKSERVQADHEVAECDFANANIMLVPKNVVSKIGVLADHFTHSLADYDYTLRARKAGFKLQVAPRYLGSCVDDHGDNWKPQGTPLRERIQYLKSPKGLAYKEYLKFIGDHFPLSYPSAFC